MGCSESQPQCRKPHMPIGAVYIVDRHLSARATVLSPFHGPFLRESSTQFESPAAQPKTGATKLPIFVGGQLRVRNGLESVSDVIRSRSDCQPAIRHKSFHLRGLGRKALAVRKAIQDPKAAGGMEAVTDLGRDQRHYVMVRGWDDAEYQLGGFPDQD